MKKILIVQTAFIGDVILATPLIEKLHQFYPDAEIDFLIRKGNEGLLSNHPFINDLIIWNKKQNKIKNLFDLIKQINNHKYDLLVNVHRFSSSGLIAFLSGAKIKAGFNKNPFSFCFDVRVKHQIGNNVHEVTRNLSLIEKFTDNSFVKPVLYPSANDYEMVKAYAFQDEKLREYITIAPSSVWYTKQWPAHQWEKLIKKKGSTIPVYLLGSPDDVEICERIVKQASQTNVTNLAGKLSFLQSAALIKNAAMNFVNDSAPMHIASAMNAPVTAIYCSTVPAFGFGPLSDRSTILQINYDLPCRPCGLHGFKACPKGHFKCAEDIII